MTELWGLGDLALALPFLQSAVQHTQVTLLAKPHAAPLLQRFAPAVELVAFDAPWTAFTGKYRLHQWPWREMRRITNALKARQFSAAVSARPDPREHLFLSLAGAAHLVGFPRAGSGAFLTRSLDQPGSPHRAAYWQSLARHFGWSISATAPKAGLGRNLVIHTGAAQPTRRWPIERYEKIAGLLRAAGWNITTIDESQGSLDALIATLATADRFMGNDSGPGHIAALLGIPTFTIFGPQLPAAFAPPHPQAAWIDGAPCRYKPCRDYCRYDAPHCLLHVSVEEVWAHVDSWLAQRR